MRARVRTGLFRSRRFSFCLIRFFAERVFANWVPLLRQPKIVADAAGLVQTRVILGSHLHQTHLAQGIEKTQQADRFCAK